MASSPTQLTLREMRKRGYIADVVERTVPKTFIKKDLFGILDVLCVGNGELVGVQCTSRTNISSRCLKIADAEATPELRDAGIRILVHGWDKPGHRYRLKEVDVS